VGQRVDRQSGHVKPPPSQTDPLPSVQHLIRSLDFSGRKTGIEFMHSMADCVSKHAGIARSADQHIHSVDHSARVVNIIERGALLVSLSFTSLTTPTTLIHGSFPSPPKLRRLPIGTCGMSARPAVSGTKTTPGHQRLRSETTRTSATRLLVLRAAGSGPLHCRSSKTPCALNS